MSPFDLDNVFVALITGLISFLVAYFTAKSHEKHEASDTRKIQVEIESELRSQLEKTDHRIGNLSDLLGREQEKRRELKHRLTDLETKDDIKTAYIRAIGHWLGGLCDVLDSEWAVNHPKPRLPAEIRTDIEKSASQNGLTVTD